MHREDVDMTELAVNAGPKDIKLGTGRISELCLRLMNPQEDLNIIHITGTNGKGSTGAFIARSLTGSGYRVGWFSSPAVTDEWECIQVLEKDEKKSDIGYNYQSQVFNKLHKTDLESKELSRINNSLKNITDFFRPDIYDECIKKIIRASEDMVAEGLEEPTVFEKQTALAYLYFHEKNVDIAVIEVGMGGADDATNIITKNLAAVFTPISKDHEAFLGNTVEEIAKIKSGIIKTECPVVTYGDKDGDDAAVKIIQVEADKKNSRVYFSDEKTISINKKTIYGSEFTYDNKEYSISLAGTHQVYNAALAIKTLFVLKDIYPDILSKTEYRHVKNAIKNINLPGRLEIISESPLVIYDGAHNPSGALALRTAIEELFSGRGIYAVCGVYEDKDYRQIIEILEPVIDEFVAIAKTSDRGLDEDLLVDVFNTVAKNKKPSGIARSVKDAVELYRYRITQTDPDGVIVVFGSLSLRKGIKNT